MPAAWFLLALSLAFTLLSWRHATDGEDQQAAQRFESAALDIRDALLERMAAHEQILRGANALFAASISVERDEWTNYVETLHLEQWYPGIQSTSFAQRVLAHEREAHTRAMRAQGFPDYAIRPEGGRPEYTPVVYIEPQSSRNLGVLGYDHFSEPLRRAAMERARDTGEAALSAKVELIRESIQDRQAGCLLYLPVYRNGAPHATVPQRRAALVGYVYASFRMKALVNGILGPGRPSVDLEIYDGAAISPDALMYDDGLHASSPPRFVRDIAIEVGGRTWTLRLSSNPVFEAQAGTTHPRMMLAGGLIISVLIFLTAASLARLQQSELRARKILQSAFDAIVIIDRGGRIVEFNPSAVRVFGYSRNQALGKDLAELIIPAALRERYRQGLARYLATGTSRMLGRQIEVRALRSDGVEFPVELTVVHVSGVDPPLFAGFIRDITARKNQEQALRESEERLQSILENVAEVFFIADGSMRGEYLSPRCVEIYGYSAEEMTARPTLWMEAIHPEDRDAVARGAAENLRKGARSVREYRIIRKDSSVRWLRSVTNPVLGADGRVHRVYGTVTDITEFESLRSSLKEKEVLLKEIHHRVKNNLQIVISLMRLESRAFADERASAVLKDLEARVRAMALVHEHLYHSRDLAKIGFKDYLKGLCQELFRTYDAGSGRMALEIDAEAVALDIERAIPCGLIINELLTNSLKYAFPGSRKGVIRVAIRNAPDNQVEIVVSDNGVGMPGTLDIRKVQTLGLQLVTTLTENQLKGSVELKRDGGTRFGIRFGL